MFCKFKLINYKISESQYNFEFSYSSGTEFLQGVRHKCFPVIHYETRCINRYKYKCESIQSVSVLKMQESKTLSMSTIFKINVAFNNSKVSFLCKLSKYKCSKKVKNII